MIYNIKKTTGFTLIETLVAILILSMAIAGPLTIASRGLGAALIAKDQTTAYYLAQDAIEFIRYDRDGTCLANSATGSCSGHFSSDYATCAPSNNGCTVDFTTNSVQSCSNSPGSTCPVLKYDAGNNYFTYTTGTPSIFRRTVVITPVVPRGGMTNTGDEYTVTATVSWSDVGQSQHQVVVTENLYNWE